MVASKTSAGEIGAKDNFRNPNDRRRVVFN